DRRVVVRAAALLVLLGALVGWFEAAPHLGELSRWHAIVLIAVVLMPVVFMLVWLVLPFWNSRCLATSIEVCRFHVYVQFGLAFVVPVGSAARLGLPDVLFFAVFLGASVRFGLRPGWTFIGMLVGLGLTMVFATWWGVDGLPALPGISLGFLIPNADLLRDQL